MSLGDLTSDDIQEVPVRIHSECLTGDLLGSMRCDCGEQLDAAFAHIAEKGAGVNYLHDWARGARNRANQQMHAYQLQSREGYDTTVPTGSLGSRMTCVPSTRVWRSSA